MQCDVYVVGSNGLSYTQPHVQWALQSYVEGGKGLLVVGPDVMPSIFYPSSSSSLAAAASPYSNTAAHHHRRELLPLQRLDAEEEEEEEAAGVGGFSAGDGGEARQHVESRPQQQRRLQQVPQVSVQNMEVRPMGGRARNISSISMRHITTNATERGC
jgi:hypothetical protein